MAVSNYKGKVIFFHMNQLGDLLFSLPVLACARKTWQDTKIYSYAKKEFAGLLKATGFVDEIIIKPGNGVFSTLAVLKAIRNENINEAALFSESPESLLLSYFAGIKESWGFQSASLSFLLKNKAFRRGVPSIENNRNLGTLLGLKDIPLDYSGLVKVPETEDKKIGEWLFKEKINSGFVVIAPGASRRRKEKYWVNENWAKVIQNIKNTSLFPVLIGAPGEMEELTLIAKNVNGPVKFFTSDNGILPIAALMKQARLFLGIDSGAMHLAASLGTKVIALFGPTDPNQVGPFPLSKNIVLKKDKISDIVPQEVIAAMASVLG